MAEDTTKILDEVKSGIGFSSTISENDVSFDGDLIPIIDGCLGELYQKGVGTSYPNRLMKDKDLTWDTFFGSDEIHDRSDAILYVITKTKILFDPPLPATMNAMIEASREALWRAGVEFDIL